MVRMGRPWKIPNHDPFFIASEDETTPKYLTPLMLAALMQNV